MLRKYLFKRNEKRFTLLTRTNKKAHTLGFNFGLFLLELYMLAVVFIPHTVRIYILLQVDLIRQCLQ